MGNEDNRSVSIKDTRFKLGAFIMSSAIRDLIKSNELQADDIWDLLKRHGQGDWGDVSEDDRILNNEAVLSGFRILSYYVLGDFKFWVITEPDRTTTTIMLFDEY